MKRFWDPLCTHTSDPAKNAWGKNFAISVVEWLQEAEEKYHSELRQKQNRIENLQSISNNNFIRSLVSEKFIIKEEVGDPPVLKKGSREDRRRILVEKYREDIRRRKAEMDECIIIEPEKPVLGKISDVEIISDSDEDCVYLASNGKSVNKLVPSRVRPMATTGVRLPKDKNLASNGKSVKNLVPSRVQPMATTGVRLPKDKNYCEVSQSSSHTVLLPEKENFAIIEPDTQNHENNRNDIVTNQKRKTASDQQPEIKKKRIFDEPEVETGSSSIESQIVKLRRIGQGFDNSYRYDFYRASGILFTGTPHFVLEICPKVLRKRLKNSPLYFVQVKIAISRNAHSKKLCMIRIVFFKGSAYFINWPKNFHAELTRIILCI